MAEKGRSHTTQAQTGVAAQMPQSSRKVLGFFVDIAAAALERACSSTHPHSKAGAKRKDITSDEDRRMNPRDEARIMARLTPRRR